MAVAGARASGGYTGVDLYPINGPGNVVPSFGNGDIAGGGVVAAGGQVVATSDNGITPAIDADGNIFGIGVDASGQWHAV